MPLDWIAAGIIGNLVLNGATKLFDIARHDSLLNKQKEDIQSQRDFQRKLQEDSFEHQRRLMSENRQMQESYPLVLEPDQIFGIYQDVVADNPPPLLVFVAPFKLRTDKINYPDTNSFPNVELLTIKTMQQILSPYYPEGSSEQLIHIKSGIWKGNHHYGDAAIISLFQHFRKLPVLVLDSNIEGGDLFLDASFWLPDNQKYVQKQIAQFPITEMLNHYAKKDARKWGEEKGKLGEVWTRDEQHIHEPNWQQLQKELNSPSTPGWNRNFTYNTSPQHFRQLAEDLAIYHAILTGWLADAMQLEYSHRVPRLPAILPNLLGRNDHLDEFIATIADSYRSVYANLEISVPRLVPQMKLELSRVLANLDNPMLATQYFDEALHSWIILRDPSYIHANQSVKTVLQLANMTETRDRADIVTLKKCVIALGLNEDLEAINQWLDAAYLQDNP